MAHGKRKKRKTRFIVTMFLEIFVILLLVVGFFMWNKLNKLQRDKSQDKTIQKSENSNTTGYRNIVLFGVDSRQNELKQGTHSDTIIIASINRKTKDVKLASIYRDTYVKIPDKNAYDKINAAYFRGGYALALSTINKNFDLDLKQYVTVNFRDVCTAIDLLGGITIDVQPNEVKYVNGYTRELNRINGTNVAGITTSGSQLLNGTQATAYARIRYTAGGDYKRTERQRIVVQKIFGKLKQSNLKTKNSFINTMFPSVATNLTNADILSLVPGILSYNIVDQTGFPYEPDAHTYQRISYVFPIDLAANVTKLHQFLFNDTKYKPSATVQQYSNEIEAIRKQ